MASYSANETSSSTTQKNGDYSKWSNADLIERVTHLEAQLRAQNIKHSKSFASSISSPPPKKKAKKPSKPFDASKYSTRHIALKLAYLGGRYNGFEHHVNNTTPLPTVEEELWRALRKTKLIFPTFKAGQSEDEVCWDGCDYSKCGRTDRGVSAFGQVVGLRVRGSQPKEKVGRAEGEVNGGSHVNGAENGDGSLIPDHEASEEGGQSVREPIWHPVRDELPYIQLLNRVLPSDIRILAWCPNPPPNFSARFNCRERRYRYFFTNPAYIPDPVSSCATTGDGWLDISAMRQAAKKFEGLHDFRNFCKVDRSKQITNFERRIFHAGIERASSGLDAGAFLTRPPFHSDKPLEMYYFEVHGSAFLWHQVRHMVAILFLVGQGYEPPKIIDRLLDVQSCPAKPVYEMADETPLVLWDCVFPELDGVRDGTNGVSNGGSGHQDALDWIYVGDSESETGSKKLAVSDAMQDRKYGRLGIMETLWSQWRKSKMDEMLSASLMDVIAQQGRDGQLRPSSESAQKDRESARVFDGSDAPRNVGRYIPLLQRNRMEKPDVLNARYAVRKGLNGGGSSPTDVDMDE